MKEFLNQTYTVSQIIGFLLVLASSSYLFYVFLIWAISSSTYM